MIGLPFVAEHLNLDAVVTLETDELTHLFQRGRIPLKVEWNVSQFSMSRHSFADSGIPLVSTSTLRHTEKLTCKGYSAFRLHVKGFKGSNHMTEPVSCPLHKDINMFQNKGSVSMIDRKRRERLKGTLMFGLRFKGVQSADSSPAFWYPPNTEQGKSRGKELLIVKIPERYK